MRFLKIVVGQLTDRKFVCPRIVIGFSLSTVILEYQRKQIPIYHFICPVCSLLGLFHSVLRSGELKQPRRSSTPPPDLRQTIEGRMRERQVQSSRCWVMWAVSAHAWSVNKGSEETVYVCGAIECLWGPCSQWRIQRGGGAVGAAAPYSLIYFVLHICDKWGRSW